MSIHIIYSCSYLRERSNSFLLITITPDIVWTEGEGSHRANQQLPGWPGHANVLQVCRLGLGKQALAREHQGFVYLYNTWEQAGKCIRRQDMDGWIDGWIFV